MRNEEINKNEYNSWLKEIKQRILKSQIKASIAVNIELLRLYWDLGKNISNKVNKSNWGAHIMEKLSTDLKKLFPDMKGFSRTNLFSIRRWYDFYSQINEDFEKVQQLVGQIPWGHNVLIITRIKEIEEAKFYINKTLENNWSRAILELQIENQLYKRQGRAITNFNNTLPEPQSNLAKETLKDPYKFDFLTLKEKVDEKDIEEQLVKNITSFLLELGTGFAFVGRQFHLQIGNNDYYIDLLFYHLKLKCYIVIELKAKSFKAEYAGKINFYLSAVNDLIKTETDNPTIGLIICKSKNKIEAEYALKGINRPIGVAEYELSKAIPEDLKSTLPSIEEIEEELNI